jgi:hypothetical protein
VFLKKFHNFAIYLHFYTIKHISHIYSTNPLHLTITQSHRERPRRQGRERIRE